MGSRGRCFIVAAVSYVHFFASSIGIAPRFYSLSDPAAFEKLLESKEEGKARQLREGSNEFSFKWRNIGE